MNDGVSVTLGWTDYPIADLGDKPGVEAPIRRVVVLSYDGNKYARCIVAGSVEIDIKVGYLYAKEGRHGEAPPLFGPRLDDGAAMTTDPAKLAADLDRIADALRPDQPDDVAALVRVRDYLRTLATDAGELCAEAEATVESLSHTSDCPHGRCSGSECDLRACTCHVVSVGVRGAAALLPRLILALRAETVRRVEAERARDQYHVLYDTERFA